MDLELLFIINQTNLLKCTYILKRLLLQNYDLKIILTAQGQVNNKELAQVKFCFIASLFHLYMKNNDYLIRSYKKFARKLKKRQEDYLK